MAAIKASFGALPAAIRRSYKAAITGLQRLAVTAAMYKAARTLGRPPAILRRPF